MNLKMYFKTFLHSSVMGQHVYLCHHSTSYINKCLNVNFVAFWLFSRFSEFDEDFTSHSSIRQAKISVSNDLIEQAASQLGTNKMLARQTSGDSNDEDKQPLGTVRRLALDKHR